jgi:hypothetical protein
VSSRRKPGPITPDGYGGAELELQLISTNQIGG